MSEQLNESMGQLLDTLEAKLNTHNTAPELPSPFTTRLVHKIDYNDLGEWAGEQLGVGRIGFIEAANDSDHDFEVHGPDYQYYDKEQADEIAQKAIERGDIAIWEAGLLLEYFCGKGLIPAGNYIVGVSW